MMRKLFSGWIRMPEVSEWEGFFSRLLFALLLVFSFRFQITFTDEPHPVGVLRLLHAAGDHSWFTFVANPDTWAIYKGLFFVLLALYVAGVGLPVVLPVMAVMHLIPFTLNNSQGYTHHGNQVVCCTIIIQAIAVLYHGCKFTLPDARLRAWMMVQSQVIITGMYFISVFSKFRNSDGAWLWNCSNVAMDMIKTQRQSFLNHLDPAFAQPPETAFWMLDHPWTARLFFGSGLILEVICILAIGHRWLAPIMGMALIGMHRSIDLLMGGVAFIYNEFLCLIFLVSLPFFMAKLLEALVRSARARWFAVAGMLIGVPLSYWLQSDRRLSLGGYLLNLVNQMNTWSSLEWETWRATLIFIAPAIACSLVMAAAGVVAAGLFRKTPAQSPA